MVGGWVCVLRGIEPFSIHGDAYVQLAVEREGSGGTWGLRASAHVMEPGVEVGGRVEVTFLMGQITRVRAVSDASQG